MKYEKKDIVSDNIHRRPEEFVKHFYSESV